MVVEKQNHHNQVCALFQHMVMVFKRKGVNNKSRLNPQINQNLGSRIQLSHIKCSSTQSPSKIPASEPSRIPTEIRWTLESIMTFLAPARLIKLVLLPLHLSAVRKPDPVQSHRTPAAVTHAAPSTGNQPSPSLLSSPSSMWEDVKKHF